MRLTAEQRRRAIVATGVELANRDGLVSVTHLRIAAECEFAMSVRLVRHYFATKPVLWQAIVSAPSASAEVRRQWSVLGKS